MSCAVHARLAVLAISIILWVVRECARISDARPNLNRSGLLAQWQRDGHLKPGKNCWRMLAQAVCADVERPEPQPSKLAETHQSGCDADHLALKLSSAMRETAIGKRRAQPVFREAANQVGGATRNLHRVLDALRSIRRYPGLLGINSKNLFPQKVASHYISTSVWPFMLLPRLLPEDQTTCKSRRFQAILP